MDSLDFSEASTIGEKMKKYVGYLLVMGIFFSGCVTDTTKDGSIDKCKYKIGDQCVKAIEKEIFDILTLKPYYVRQYISDNVKKIPYSKIIFSEEDIKRITHIEGFKSSSRSYAWSIKDNIVFIAYDDDGYEKFKIKKEKHSIKFYNINTENNCRIWDSIKQARKSDSCIFLL